MAQRRMVSLRVIDTDLFLVLPSSSRLLYYDLLMRADDDGFVDSPKKIIRMTGASEDDFKILCAKQYIIPFDSGVCVIKHWRVHNLIRSDRYTETQYHEEKENMIIERGKYFMKQNVIPLVADCEPQVRLGKDSICKDSIGEGKQKSRFSPPLSDELQLYLNSRQIKSFTALQFIDFYESKGWMIGKNKMRDWRAAVRTWEKRDSEKNQTVIQQNPADRLRELEEIGKN